jgi:hypothetical protein
VGTACPPRCEPDYPSQIQLREHNNEKCNENCDAGSVTCGVERGSSGARAGTNEDADGDTNERSHATGGAGIHSGKQSRATRQSSHYLHSAQHRWQEASGTQGSNVTQHSGGVEHNGRSRDTAVTGLPLCEESKLFGLHPESELRIRRTDGCWLWRDCTRRCLRQSGRLQRSASI